MAKIIIVNDIDNELYLVRKYSITNPQLHLANMIGIFFRDGYLEVRIWQTPGPNKLIKFAWYFASEPIKRFLERTIAIRKNWDVIDSSKGDKYSTAWNYFSSLNSRKDGIEKMHKFMKAYIKYTPKQ